MAINSLADIPRLFHFTDRRNLDLIRQHGGIYPLSELEGRGVEIPAPGGNPLSWNLDRAKGFHRYVHLCFRAKHPMEYVARQDNRIVDSVFLEIHPSVLQFSGVLFSSDVSNKTGVVPIPISSAVIDYEVLYTRTDWTQVDIQNRLQAAEKSEVLVPQYIPLTHIRGL